MADNSLNISIPLKFEIKTPPKGMTDYDPKALSPEQQRELNDYKLAIRKENIMYLSNHPEVRAIVSMVIRMTEIRQPLNIIEFVANIFTRPEKELRQEIDKIMKESDMEYDTIPFGIYEDWDY